MQELKPCPKCGISGLYKFTQNDSKHHFGYKVICSCGYAWQESIWKATKEEIIESWNRMISNG